MKKRLAVFLFLGTVFTLAVNQLSCSSDNPSGPQQPPPDTLQPEVMFASPANQSVISDTVTLVAQPQGGDSIAYVQFYRNDSLLAGSRDSTQPFSFTVDLTNLPIGGTADFVVKGFDNKGDSAAGPPLVLYHLWRPLISDPDEAQARDISKVFIRSSDSTVEFRVVTNGNWTNYKSSTAGIDVALFIDTDRDRSTGDTAVSNNTIPLNDIGADIRAIIGTHGDSLWQFIDNGQVWGPVHGSGGFAYRKIAADTNVFEVGIYRSRLVGNPDTVYVVAANVLLSTNPFVWDWAPDAGHATYILGDMHGLFPAPPLPGAEKPQRLATGQAVTKSPFE
ncbi:MAG: hypothetical protein D6800_04935 [Candidatus Zixiibacteriota bacterium]|nr:MAG: hypothetical protein D6800_04935 [candidate division Zixibacteria bacterium]